MKLTQATAIAIATAVSQLRDDWDHPGIVHALRTEADRGTTAEDAFVAIANLVRNRDARTPRLLNKPGRHWATPDAAIVRRGDHAMPCPTHDDQTEPCPACRDTPIDPAVTAAGIAAVRAAMKAAPGYVPRPPATDQTEHDARIATARMRAEQLRKDKP